MKGAIKLCVSFEQQTARTARISSLNDLIRCQKRLISINTAINNNLRASKTRKLRRVSQPEYSRGADGVFSIPYTTAESDFVFGARAVKAALDAGRRTIYTLYIPARSSHKWAAEHPKVKGKRVKIVEETDRVFFDKFVRAVTLRTGNRPDAYSLIHDQTILECSALPIKQLPTGSALGAADPEDNTFEVGRSEAVGRRMSNTSQIPYEDSKKRQPFLVWLAGVENTDNAGAIARSAAYFGADGLILNSRGTVTTSPTLSKQSAGALEFLPLFLTDDPKSLLANSQKYGWKFLAAVPRPDRRKTIDFSTPDTLQESLKQFPCVLCLGNEARGLPKWMMDDADKHLSIYEPSTLARKAGVDSLNVSVAAGILLDRLHDVLKLARDK